MSGIFVNFDESVGVALCHTKRISINTGSTAGASGTRLSRYLIKQANNLSHSPYRDAVVNAPLVCGLASITNYSLPAVVMGLRLSEYRAWFMYCEEYNNLECGGGNSSLDYFLAEQKRVENTLPNCLVFAKARNRVLGDLLSQRAKYTLYALGKKFSNIMGNMEYVAINKAEEEMSIFIDRNGRVISGDEFYTKSSPAWVGKMMFPEIFINKAYTDTIIIYPQRLDRGVHVSAKNGVFPTGYRAAQRAMKINEICLGIK